MKELMYIGTAFGLTVPAGLNAYIPLFVAGLAIHFGVIQAAEPFDVLGQPWALVLIGIFLIIELIVDKFPVADHLNDVVQTAIRPTAGAILFAAEAGVIIDASPWLFLLVGLIVAGGVHAAKATARPVVTATTIGHGNAVVSSIEDGVASFLSVTAVVVPIVAVVSILVFAAIAAVLLIRFRRRKRSGHAT